ncbi:NADPH:quinone reductase [Aeromicrobium sp. CTD01-1L150]|uniref:NADPH:quinone reductase n=1 Tax=Aeromicrobium sp. CTD01-1L150 TaxID=3341830 RepID=UPI0035C0D9A1
MRAALYRRPGPAAEVLEIVDLDTPEPGPGEVRVRIVTSGINPTDWKTRDGHAGRTPDGFQVPHQDGSGVVDAIGVGVDHLAVGQRVWLYLSAFGNRYGTAAEYAVVPAERAVTLPERASFDLGACLGVPALTAAHCLGGDPGPLAGKVVLVAGGAGAVGHFAIELAKHAGAQVVTTVSSEAKGDLAVAAGADAVVLYSDPDAAEQVLETVGRVDRIIEVALATNLELDLAVAAPGATIATYAAAGDLTLPASDFMAANLSLSFTLLYGLTSEQTAAAVRWTSEAIAVGSLTPLPVHPYPLEQIATAQDRVAEAPVGKVLLRIAEQ